MAQKGPPTSWKWHDFPERFKTTSGTKFGKNGKQKWIRPFWDTLGQPMGTKKLFWGGSEKLSAFLSCIWPDFISMLGQTFMFFMSLIGSLNLSKNQHNMYNKTTTMTRKRKRQENNEGNVSRALSSIRRTCFRPAILPTTVVEWFGERVSTKPC